MRRGGLRILCLLLMLQPLTSLRAHEPVLTDEMLAYVKRDGLMHLINAQRYILQQMLVGRHPVNQEEFVRAAHALDVLFAMVPSTFENPRIAAESRARPEIWQNWDDFIARAEEQRRIAAELAALAEIRGAEAVIEQVRLLDCGNCHDVYRRND